MRENDWFSVMVPKKIFFYFFGQLFDKSMMMTRQLVSVIGKSGQWKMGKWKSQILSC